MSDEELRNALKKLREAFHPDDIEWRVMRSMPWGQNVRCLVYPYVTARAIHQRLDDVIGPENWCNTQQSVTAVDQGKNGPVLSIEIGISIRCNGEWITKYNVSEATDVEPAKGAFSGAEKRAAEEWGIGRYLWLLGELDAETTRQDPGRGNGWFYGKMSERHGSGEFWWKPPRLPAWALPPEAESDDRPVTDQELTKLKLKWAKKFAPLEKNRSVKAEKFATFVRAMFGQTPVDNPSGWTQEMIHRANAAVDNAVDGSGMATGVPFE